MIDYRHDPQADAVYIRLSDKPYSYGEELDRERRIDYAADGTAIGVELLCVSSGVDVRDLPDQETIAGLLTRHRIKVLAS